MNINDKLDRKVLNNFQIRAEEMHDKEPAYRRKMQIDMLVMLIFAALFALSFNTFIFRIIRVEGPSMEPTFFTDQKVLVDKVAYKFREPKRGEVVICYYNRNGNLIKGDDPVIKRVIALPDEKVEIIAGKILINGVELNESEYWQDYINQDMAEYIVPKDCIFVVGDNRNNSDDSRNSAIEAVHDENIVGIVRVRIWPFSEIGRINPAKYLEAQENLPSSENIGIPEYTQNPEDIEILE